MIGTYFVVPINPVEMKLNERISKARKEKGFTQEELADLAQVTVRTIQRVEYGESVPRSYTLKAIAKALDLPYEMLTVEVGEPSADKQLPAEEVAHFLNMVNLSCFVYLIIPWVHFLVPHLLLKRKKNIGKDAIALGRKIVRQQIYWVVLFQLLMFLTLAYNYVMVTVSGNRCCTVRYLWPLSFMYLMNAVLIIYNNRLIQRRFLTY